MLAGLTWSILFTFGPVYARRAGFDAQGIGLLMGLAMAAGGIAQFPLGWLSDVASRRAVIAVMFGAGLVVSLFGIWSAELGMWPNLIAAAVTGGCVFPIYAVSVAHVNDAITAKVRVAASAALVLLFGVGSILGPLLCGVAMGLFGLTGFFALLALAMLVGCGLSAAYA
ncbi:MAG: MFS transporter [Alphaproteobacteria bacterium]|nr:MFS transporter [Alphaproteobacteria bacterium]